MASHIRDFAFTSQNTDRSLVVASIDAKCACSVIHKIDKLPLLETHSP